MRITDKNSGRIIHMTKIAIFRTVSFCLWGGLIFIHCAVQGPPSGGPEDRTPPAVIVTIPENGAANVPVASDIEITFSEQMNRSSVQSALFIAPAIKTDYYLNWQKDRLVIHFNTPLQLNQTYVISIGTAAQDRHRNSFGKTESFAFSTGKYLDRGIITGIVYNEDGKPAQQALIYAYRLEGTSHPNPLTDTAEYILQTGTDGRFKLTYLHTGTYRIFAVSGGAGISPAVPQSSSTQKNFNTICFPCEDIPIRSEGNIPDSVTTLLTFFPTAVDTLPPALYRVEPIDRNHIRIHFTEATASKSISANRFRIYRIPDMTEIPNAVSSYYYDAQAGKSVTLFMNNLTPGTQYCVRIDSVSDLSGNMLMYSPGIAGRVDSARIFTAESAPDTVRFSIERIKPPDSSANVSIYTQVSLFFSAGLSLRDFSKALSITDSSSTVIPGIYSVVHPSSIQFCPDDHFALNSTYRITINPDSLFSIEKKPLSIKKSVFSFTTANPMNTGSISGTVSVNEDSLPYPIIITVLPSGGFRSGFNSESSYTQLLTGSGDYSFEGILAGEYGIIAFIDRNGDGVWNPGRIKPFEFAEPVALFPQPVSVRPGIENTGINLSISLFQKNR